MKAKEIMPELVSKQTSSDVNHQFEARTKHPCPTPLLKVTKVFRMNVTNTFNH